MSILLGYLNKLIKYVPKNIGGILGIIQAVLSFVREVCMLAARLICPIIPGDQDDKVVAFIDKLAGKISSVIEKVKNWLLALNINL